MKLAFDILLCNLSLTGYELYYHSLVRKMKFL